MLYACMWNCGHIHSNQRRTLQRLEALDPVRFQRSLEAAQAQAEIGMDRRGQSTRLTKFRIDEETGEVSRQVMTRWEEGRRIPAQAFPVKLDYRSDEVARISPWKLARVLEYLAESATQEKTNAPDESANDQTTEQIGSSFATFAERADAIVARVAETLGLFAPKWTQHDVMLRAMDVGLTSLEERIGIHRQA